ncbi:hypothetical protein LAJ19_16825 (plasmid) [Deinococcus taeanensis]|uniref:hypothetical protein n=1 Tax=Deinococcus taeanensis TaxID=2737050 RepID=UPI001CDB8ED6|nr:hypothetical protein [Deinococcus taeanensis]UBV44450.1 hypothetical protein LAJ19_16825 [Deinococcus taeanensis]
MTTPWRGQRPEVRELGVALDGLSTQDPVYPQEMKPRSPLPFPVPSDDHQDLTQALSLPNFSVQGVTLLRRLTLFVRDGQGEHTMQPVFSPHRPVRQGVAQHKAEHRGPNKLAGTLHTETESQGLRGARGFQAQRL